MQITWKIGDRVVHPGKPEWGAGVVRALAAHTQGGRHGQRLTIRFDGAGTKTISTTMVELRGEGEMRADLPRSSATSMPTGPGEIGEQARISRLPADLEGRDIPPAVFLRRSMRWYRFDPTGRGMLDWGIARMEIADPLGVLTREQLGECFSAFFRMLDFRVAEAARDIRRQTPVELAALLRDAPHRMRALLGANGRR